MMKPRRSAGKIVVGVVLAIIFGVLQPFVLMFQAMLPPCVSIITMLLVALSVYGGLIPAAVMALIGTLITLLGYGTGIGLAAIPLVLMPAAVMIFGIRRRKPFEAQAKSGLISGILGAVLAVVIVTVSYGTDAVAQLFEMIRQVFEMMKEPLLEAFNMSMPEGYELVMEDYTALYYDSLRSMQQFYEINLLPNLISGSVFTVALSLLWGNWLAARRGEATSASFKSPADWFLPSNLTLGLLTMMIFSALLKLLPIRGADAVWLIVSGLSCTAFAVQGFAALDRRLKKNGASPTRRVTMTVLLILFGSYATRLILGMDVFGFMAIVGGLSAIFGRKGAARPWIEKTKKNMNGEDR